MKPAAYADVRVLLRCRGGGIGVLTSRAVLEATPVLGHELLAVDLVGTVPGDGEGLVAGKSYARQGARNTTRNPAPASSPGRRADRVRDDDGSGSAEERTGLITDTDRPSVGVD